MEFLVYLRCKGGDGVAAYDTIMNNEMTQDERWMVRYEEAMRFLQENHWKPSRYVAEERDLRNWWKATKKKMNAGELKPERVELFERLLALAEENKHVNQYV